LITCTAGGYFHLPLVRTALVVSLFRPGGFRFVKLAGFLIILKREVVTVSHGQNLVALKVWVKRYHGTLVAG